MFQCWIDSTGGGHLGIEYPCCGYPEYYCDKPNLNVCVKRTRNSRNLMAYYSFNLQDEPPVSENRESPISSEGSPSVSKLHDDLEARRFSLGNFPSRPINIPVSEDKLDSGKSDQDINRPPGLRSQPNRIPISIRAFASLNIF